MPFLLLIDRTSTDFRFFPQVKQLGEGSNKTGQKATSYEIDGVIPPAMNNTLAVTADGDVYVADPDKLFRCLVHMRFKKSLHFPSSSVVKL